MPAADLEEALDTLLEVMQKIDKETRVAFKTFDSVNKKLMSCSRRYLVVAVRHWS